MATKSSEPYFVILSFVVDVAVVLNLIIPLPFASPF